jgi:hypothetical protein
MIASQAGKQGNINRKYMNVVCRQQIFTVREIIIFTKQIHAERQK